MNSKQRRQTRRKNHQLRGAMQPAPGRRYIDADYAAIEFRMMAMIAEGRPAVDVDTDPHFWIGLYLANNDFVFDGGGSGAELRTWDIDESECLRLSFNEADAYDRVEFWRKAMGIDSVELIPVKRSPTNNWWQEIDSPTGRSCGRLIRF